MSVLATFTQLSHAAFKAAGATLRRGGLVREDPRWPEKASICERCPLRVVQCNVSYCGKPFLAQMDRDPILDGCGCPTRAKAKDPAEHCPLTSDHSQPARTEGACNCKWCKGLSLK